MVKLSERTLISLRGVRQNNLKNFDLDLPLKRLIVITGLSGSGKSSLAFDTLFAEGQRRYIETFSPYARQFFDRMDKPQVDSIQGIPPAIAIEQRNTVKTTRSTVGTMTEITDYMKVLWPHLAVLHCRACGRPVTKESIQQVWNGILREFPSAEVLITFDLPLTEKLPYNESLSLISKQGYQRLLLNDHVLRVEEALDVPAPKDSVTVVQDRLRVSAENRARFVEACEHAYRYGKGKLSVRPILQLHLKPNEVRKFSNRLHCAQCDIDYKEPSPALFSFNHPAGACATCRGFGRVISIDYSLAIPDRSRTLSQGVVKPWLTGQGQECQTDLLRVCKEQGIHTNIPFCELPDKWQRFVIEGAPNYGKDQKHEWPMAWYGVKGYFRWLESRAYKMHVRVLLSRYRAYTTCPDCGGTRLQPESLLYRINPADPKNEASSPLKNLSLPDFYRMPVRDAAQIIKLLAGTARAKASKTLQLAFDEIGSRLGYLNDVGLGYLSLDRSTRTLSGGETERVNLTTCLGTCLVNTLFVLDEPSVGLHPRDTDRLVGILKRLRDAGNTVVVVEHETSVMQAADQIVDLGPGHGTTGGNVVFQGTYKEVLTSHHSITGDYLSGRKKVDLARRRPVEMFAERSQDPHLATRRVNHSAEAMREAPHPFRSAGDLHAWLILRNAHRYNLKNVTLQIPLGRFVSVTGVSGSGKSTLLREVLFPALTAKLGASQTVARAADSVDKVSEEEQSLNDDSTTDAQATLSGTEHLDRVVFVDQSGLGKTPRSNPAVYIGAFEHIRDCFAQTELARTRGMNSSAFSFNSGQGQCERCRGAGFEKIEMQFLSDVFIRCPDCGGRRYRSHILEIKLECPEYVPGIPREAWSIADVLDTTVEQAVEFLSAFEDLRPAKRAVAALQLLIDVGLGYLKVGQPINTLSGGESQRLKLVRHLSEAAEASSTRALPNRKLTSAHLRNSTTKRTLFLFDEPTTGLHFDDVRILVGVFQRLVDAGNSVLVIEHNLDVIRCSDWVIDLGPGAGDEGGQIVAEGTPEEIARCSGSHTGKALRSTRIYRSSQISYPRSQSG